MFKRYWWVLLVMVPVGTMAGLLVAAAITSMFPKRYESSAVIEIKPSVSVNKEAVGQPTRGNSGEEPGIINSHNVLMRVVDALELPHKWGMGKESAVRELKSIVRVKNIKGTDLVAIRARHTNKEDARDIAAEVARAYGRYRSELEGEFSEKSIDVRKRAVREQEGKVEERRKILAAIAKTKGAEGDGNPVNVQEHIDAKRDFETDLTLLEHMKIMLITEEIAQGLPGQVVVIHDDPVISDSPVSPNVTLNLVVGAAVGLLLSPFFALLLMWMMNRRNGRDGISEPYTSV
jgi:uncharacterized protein involved in exopolysaccharide biosynthesis